MDAESKPAAQVRLLSAFDDGGENALLRKLRKHGRWRMTVLMGAALTTCVLLVNLSVLIWVRESLGPRSGFFELFTGPGTTAVFNGSCSKAKSITLWATLAVNILSTLLLGSGNYCTQLLLSPTREDMTKAHAEGTWMDIGVSSMRNLVRIPTCRFGFRRLYLCILLFLSSVPLHLLYNSVIFDTPPVYIYHAILVTQDFVDGADYDLQFVMNGTRDLMTGSEIRYLQTQALKKYGQLERLENADCIRRYGNPSGFEPSIGNVLLVSSALQDNSVMAMWDHTPGSFDEPWLCPYETKTSFCDLTPLIATAKSWAIPGDVQCEALGGLDPKECVDALIDYCLVHPPFQVCTVQINATLLWIVVICNLMKIGCLAATWMLTSNFSPWSGVPYHKIIAFRPLVTIGDAISSFLDSPEQETSRMGPVSAKQLRDKAWRRHFAEQGQNSTLFQRRSQRWFEAVSIKQWIACTLFIIVAWGAALALVLMGIRTANNGDNTLSELWREGVGSLNADNMVGGSHHWSSIHNVLLANTPQIVISFLYLLYNNILTYMVLAYEYSRFSRIRKTLRVGCPIGNQRSTFWLQLPYQYSFPLMGSMAVLHWLISRSLFIADTVARYEDGDTIRTYDDWINAHGLGYSPIAIILALLLGGAMVVALFGLSMRKLDPGMPIVGSCSLAVSAACHPPSDEKSISAEALMYGVIEDDISDEQACRHAGFSSKEVTPLADGVLYI